jgi:hypothetical protein
MAYTPTLAIDYRIQAFKSGLSLRSILRKPIILPVECSMRFIIGVYDVLDNFETLPAGALLQVKIQPIELDGSFGTELTSSDTSAITTATESAFFLGTGHAEITIGPVITAALYEGGGFVQLSILIDGATIATTACRVVDPGSTIIVGGVISNPSAELTPTGLIANYEADVDYNESTGAWGDQSTQNNDLTLTSGSVPTKESAWSNNRPVIAFNGSYCTDFMSGRSTQFLSHIGDGTVYFVGEWRTTSGGGFYFTQGSFGSWGIDRSSTTVRCLSDGTNTAYRSMTTSVTSSPTIVGVRWIAKAGTWRINTSSGTFTHVGNADPSSTIYVGRSWAGSTAEVAFGQLVVYTTALSDADFDTNYEAIADAWNIAHT